MGYPSVSCSGYHVSIRGRQYEFVIITDVIIAEHGLREVIQLEEKLQYKVTALQKAITLESDRTQFEEVSQELEDVQRQNHQKEYALYEAEIMLDRDLKCDLDHTRQKAMWYMRKDMVEDCSGRGGCCSRSCRCCSQRQLSKREKGRGHCTTECWCCTNWRGFELSHKEKYNRRGMAWLPSLKVRIGLIF